jgi:hypothetical protein
MSLKESRRLSVKKKRSRKYKSIYQNETSISPSVSCWVYEFARGGPLQNEIDGDLQRFAVMRFVVG